MHDAVLQWLGGIKLANPGMFTGKRVLECGSFNINGSPRQFFDDCDYIGIDWREGPDVDIVATVHTYHPPEPFDVVVSTEMLEHDPFWMQSITRMLNVLKRGGHLLLTFGGIDRKIHEVETAPIKGYYGGLGSDYVYRRLLLHKFDTVHISDDRNDVYIWGETKR